MFPRIGIWPLGAGRDKNLWQPHRRAEGGADAIAEYVVEAVRSRTVSASEYKLLNCSTSTAISRRWLVVVSVEVWIAPDPRASENVCHVGRIDDECHSSMSFDTRYAYKRCRV